MIAELGQGRNTAAAAAFVAPLLALAALRFMGEAGPTPAPAAPPAAAAVAPESSRALTKEQARAEEWVSAWKPSSTLESPMLYPEHVEAEIPAVPAATAQPMPRAAPEFTVKSVMGAGDRVMASINGKVLRVGDEPAPGWKIIAMDAKSKEVEIAGPEGRSITISPQTKPR